MAFKKTNFGAGTLTATIALAASAQMALGQMEIALAQATPDAAAAKPAVPAFNPASIAISQRAMAYRNNPDETTWREFLETMRIYLSDGRVLKTPSTTIIQANPALKDFQAKVFDAAGARVWNFPGAQNNHSMVIQSGVAPTPEGGSAARVNIIDYPETVNISAARIVRSFTTKTVPVKVGRRKIVQKTVKVEGPSLMAVAGLDRISGLVWLGAWKPSQGTWIPTSEPFSQIPSHFLQNLSGQASFSGNDLVLSVSSQTDTNAHLPKPKSSSYQIVMKFVGGHFVLAGSPGKDMPLSVVSYFVQCVRLNRMDLGKAWISDPQLASIPKYAGLIGKNGEPYKLIAMSQPASGGSRYRLVTNSKYDLIFDVGKVKKDILIKGIFIAPPDPLARNLTGTVIGGATPPPTTGEDAAKTGTPPNGGSQPKPAAPANGAN